VSSSQCFSARTRLNHEPTSSLQCPGRYKPLTLATQMFMLRSMSTPNLHGGWVENLRYSVQVFTNADSIEEVVARVSELVAAQAVFDLTVSQRPGKVVMLCQKARVLRRSDG
jgi:hypothetical protein